MSLTPLITATDVVAIAFEDNHFDTSYIKDDLILAVQNTHFRDLLGKDFFEELMAGQAAASHTAANQTLLEGYLKKSLAWYVKYYLMPGLAVRLSNAGVVRNSETYVSPASPAEVEALRNSALSMANTWRDMLVEFLEKEENKVNYPTYHTAVTAPDEAKPSPLFRVGLVAGRRE